MLLDNKFQYQKDLFPPDWETGYNSNPNLMKHFISWYPSNFMWRRQWQPTPVLLPWVEEPGGLQSMGSQRVRHNWATSLSLCTFMRWRRKWQPTCVPAWRIPGMGEPGGLPSMESHRVGHNWSDLAAAGASNFTSWFPNVYMEE